MSQCQEILNCLMVRGEQGATTVELGRVSGSLAVHSRICDLRAAGYRLSHTTELKRSRKGKKPKTIVIHRYRLIQNEATTADPVAA